MGKIAGADEGQRGAAGKPLLRLYHVYMCVGQTQVCNTYGATSLTPPDVTYSKVGVYG